MSRAEQDGFKKSFDEGLASYLAYRLAGARPTTTCLNRLTLWRWASTGQEVKPLSVQLSRNCHTSKRIREV